MFRSCVCFFCLTFLGVLPASADDFVIDFTTARSYLQSLQNIRSSIGTRISNIPAEYNVFSINQNTPEHGNHVITLRGIIDDSFQVVLDQRSLYIIGFVGRDNVFHRLSGYESNPALTGTTVNDLTVTGHYRELDHIAAFPNGRSDLLFSRYYLQNAAETLSAHGSNVRTLNNEEARALLRFITVISEAIRFRAIGRDFAISVLQNEIEYNLSQEQLNYVRSWSPLSGVVRNVDDNNTSVRVRGIELDGYSAIAAVLGILLACRQAASGSTRYNDVCVNDIKTKKINGKVWDVSILAQEL